MTRTARAVLLATCVGVAAGFADVAVRFAHPDIAYSASSFLAVVVLYAVLWMVGGLVLALALAKRTRLERMTLAAAWATAALVVAGGYANIYWLPSLFDLRSLAFDLVWFLVCAGLAVAWLRRGDAVSSRVMLAHVGLALLALSTAQIAVMGSGRSIATIASRPTVNGPDILVVLFDALRADHTTMYGYERATTPTMQAIADRGTVFERAYSASSWTKPSVATLMTGLSPESHGNHSISSRLPLNAVTLAEVLRDGGYRTGVFAENSFVSPLFGYDRGADRVVCNEADVLAQTVVGQLWRQLSVRWRPLQEVERLALAVNVLDPAQRAKAGMDLPRAFLEWVDEIGDERFFGYVHLMKPHAPYIAPEPFDGAFGAAGNEVVDPPLVQGLAPFATAADMSTQARRELIDNYDERILYGDSMLARIVDGLGERDRWRDTVVVLLADHGEEFGENGLWDHGHSLQEGVVRIPLVLRVPKRESSRRDDLVRLLDLPPTLVDLAGLPPVDQFDGRSLLPLIDGVDLTPRPVLLQVRHGTGFWSNALRVADAKFVRTEDSGRSAALLFDLAADPGETVDLASAQQAQRMRLQQELDDAVLAAGLKKQVSSDAVVDADTLEKLRALGYIE